MPGEEEISNPSNQDIEGSGGRVESEEVTAEKQRLRRAKYVDNVLGELAQVEGSDHPDDVERRAALLDSLDKNQVSERELISAFEKRSPESNEAVKGLNAVTEGIKLQKLREERLWQRVAEKEERQRIANEKKAEETERVAGVVKLLETAALAGEMRNAIRESLRRPAGGSGPKTTRGK